MKIFKVTTLLFFLLLTTSCSKKIFVSNGLGDHEFLTFPKGNSKYYDGIMYWHLDGQFFLFYDELGLDPEGSPFYGDRYVHLNEISKDIYLKGIKKRYFGARIKFKGRRTGHYKESIDSIVIEKLFYREYLSEKEVKKIVNGLTDKNWRNKK